MGRKIRILLIAGALVAAAPWARAEKVRASFLFDETEDRLTVRLWLEREGTVMRNTASDKFGKATLEIYDEETDDWFPAQTIAPPDPSDLVTHIFTWTLDDATKATSSIQLHKGRTYFARCTMRYGGPSGTGFTYQTGETFTVSATSSLQSVSASAASLRSKIADIETTITEENTLTRELADSKAGGVLVASETTGGATSGGATTGEATTIEGGAGEALLVEEAEIMTSETKVLLGSLVTIRFRTYPGVSPVVTVYDPDRVVRVATARMTEEERGLYRYFLRLASWWPEGDYTVICSEAQHGTMDTLVLHAKRPDLATIAGAPVPEDAAALDDSESKVRALSATMEIVEARLTKAAEAMNRMQPGMTGMTEVAEEMASLYNDLKVLSGLLKSLGTDPAGFSDLEEGRSKDFGYLRNKLQEFRALVDLSRRLLEPAFKNEPLVQVWMEFR